MGLQSGMTTHAFASGDPGHRWPRWRRRLLGAVANRPGAPLMGWRDSLTRVLERSGRAEITIEAVSDHSLIIGGQTHARSNDADLMRIFDTLSGNSPQSG